MGMIITGIDTAVGPHWFVTINAGYNAIFVLVTMSMNNGNTYVLIG